MSESIASEVLSASLGGAVSATVLYPLEVLKTKMQAETKKDKVNDEDTENSENDPSEFAMIEYAQYLYKNHGMGVFFAGVETSAFQSATEKALYFFAYTIMKNAYKAVAHTKELSALTTLALGYLAEWAHLPVTLPLDCWTTKIQTDASGKDPIQLLLLMLSEKGIAGMYKGVQAYVVLCFKPALQYTVFERVKAALVANRRNKTLSASESFLLGMVARTISTVLIFPYLRAKVVLQTSDSPTTTSIPDMLRAMYTKGGLASWFQGLGPELTRGVLSSALMLMIKEQLSTVVYNLVHGPTKKQLTR